ncbi:hypothetical protein HMPREF1550_00059 [Actinomyces sp. oral taxon 877 str. F0543]|nr:hypothetical protein HMPREF1550_00059 [Actinomyces sp. oral taxon 877 str. F0543]
MRPGRLPERTRSHAHGPCGSWSTSRCQFMLRKSSGRVCTLTFFSDQLPTGPRP